MKILKGYPCEVPAPEGKKVPDTIFFLNTGVRLTTTSEEVIGRLKELDSIGAMIFT